MRAIPTGLGRPDMGQYGPTYRNRNRVVKILTGIVQIGNSDNKLTQQEWAAFVETTNTYVKCCSKTIHFSGGSPSHEAWQNHCWVVELKNNDVANLKHFLNQVRIQYRQDSIAFTIGETQFI